MIRFTGRMLSGANLQPMALMFSGCSNLVYVTEQDIVKLPNLSEYMSQCPKSPEGHPILDVDPKTFQLLLRYARYTSSRGSGEWARSEMATESAVRMHSASFKKWFQSYLGRSRVEQHYVLEKMQQFGLPSPFLPFSQKPVLSENPQDPALEEIDSSKKQAHPNQLPKILVVHLADQFQQEVGVKRHAINITYGCDGCDVSKLCLAVRKDLNRQLSTTYWQMHKSHERAAAFVCTKIPNGTADLLLTTLTQNMISHTERLGFRLHNSYVTMTPDPGHTKVRLLLHVFIFRKKKGPTKMVAPSMETPRLREEISAVQEAMESTRRSSALGLPFETDMDVPNTEASNVAHLPAQTDPRQNLRYEAEDACTMAYPKPAPSAQASTTSKPRVSSKLERTRMERIWDES